MVNWDMMKIDQSMAGDAAPPKNHSWSGAVPTGRASRELARLVPIEAAAEKKFGSRRNGNSDRDRDAGRTSYWNRTSHGSRSTGSIQQTPA